VIHDRAASGSRGFFCTFASPAAGIWYVTVRGYSSYSGVILSGDHDK
jgi:hypothetical protein